MRAGFSAVVSQGQKLTEKEQRELEYNRQVYELAMLRKKQEEELQNRDEYHMPTSYDAEGQNQNKRYEVLSARYRSVPARLPHRFLVVDPREVLWLTEYCCNRVVCRDALSSALCMPCWRVANRPSS